MTRYEKLIKDCATGKINVEILSNFLSFCPSDESVFGLKYGEDSVEKPEYFKLGIKMRCKKNLCSLCRRKEYIELNEGVSI